MTTKTSTRPGACTTEPQTRYARLRRNATKRDQPMTGSVCYSTRSTTTRTRSSSSLLPPDRERTWPFPTTLRASFPINVSWNTFWDVATKRNADGWFAEMRIPLSSLRFQTEAGRVEMGLILVRIIARNFEFDTFPAIEPKWGTFGVMKPSVARKIVLEGVQNKKPFYITPYWAAGSAPSPSTRPKRPTGSTGYPFPNGTNASSPAWYSSASWSCSASSSH